MKEATGELNMTVVTVVAIAAVGAFFYLFIWPSIQRGLTMNTCNNICPGAARYLNEVAEDRKVKNRLIQLLQSGGHTVYDCTDDVGRTSGANLANICAKCNSHNVNLDISIHLNAGGGTGVEVWYYTGSSAGANMASKVSASIASALGIRNRGAKASSGLYVLRNTKATAILIECCFVDNMTDKNAWNANKCADAIYKAVVGGSIPNVPVSSGGGGNSNTSSTVGIITPPISILYFLSEKVYNIPLSFL